MFALNMTFDGDVEDFRKTVEGKIESIKRGLAESVKESIEHEIKKRVLVDDSGWIAWYLRSMSWEEKNGNHSLQVDEKIRLGDIPKERSLIWIEKGALASLNPWPIESIPPIKGGYDGRGVVKPVGRAEFKFHKNRIEKLGSQIINRIREEGLELGNHLSFDEGFEVDVDFLVKRIEHGQGDFERQPHLVFLKRFAKKV